MSNQDDGDDAPLLKPSAMKGRGVALPGLGGAPGFKPPLAGLKPSMGVGGGGGGAPAGLAEALAKRRQKQRKSEEENNNNKEEDEDGAERGVFETADGDCTPRETSDLFSTPPKSHVTPPKWAANSTGTSSTGPTSTSKTEKNRSASRKSEGTDDGADASTVDRGSAAPTTKGKRISSIQAGLNFNPMMLRPSPPGHPSSTPPSSSQRTALSGPTSPVTPLSPQPVPIDLSAPPPLLHTKSLLTNDAIKSRPKVAAQRKPQTRRARKANSTRDNRAVTTKPVVSGSKSLPLLNGFDTPTVSGDASRNEETKTTIATIDVTEGATNGVSEGAPDDVTEGTSDDVTDSALDDATDGAPDDVTDAAKDDASDVTGLVEDVTDGGEKNETEDGQPCDGGSQPVPIKEDIPSRKEGHDDAKENDDEGKEGTVADTQLEDIFVAIEDTTQEKVGDAPKTSTASDDHATVPSIIETCESPTPSTPSPPSSPLPPPLPTSSPPPLDDP